MGHDFSSGVNWIIGSSGLLSVHVCSPCVLHPFCRVQDRCRPISPRPTDFLPDEFRRAVGLAGSCPSPCERGGCKHVPPKNNETKQNKRRSITGWTTSSLLIERMPVVSACFHGVVGNHCSARPPRRRSRAAGRLSSVSVRLVLETLSMGTPVGVNWHPVQKHMFCIVCVYIY